MQWLWSWYLNISVFLSWQVGDRLDECKRFETTWVNAVNLCELAAEAAYTSGVCAGGLKRFCESEEELNHNLKLPMKDRFVEVLSWVLPDSP